MVGYTPTARIVIAGADLTRPVWEHLQSLTCDTSEQSDSDFVEIAMANDPPFAIPQRGAEVRLWLGWHEEGLHFMGLFEVDEVGIDLNPATMSIRARSASFSAGSDKSKEDVEWEAISLADLAEKIAQRHGYGCKVTMDVYYDAIAQTQESDLHFLKRLAQEANGSFAIKDKTILIFPPDVGSRPQATLRYTESCLGRFTVADRNKYGVVEARWWDAEAAEEQLITVGDGNGVPYAIKRRFGNAAEAQMAAQNKMELLRRGMVEGSLTVPGDATLVAGAEISLVGFRPRALDGQYLGTKIKQKMNQSGWTTDVTLEKLP